MGLCRFLRVNEKSLARTAVTTCLAKRDASRCWRAWNEPACLAGCLYIPGVHSCTPSMSNDPIHSVVYSTSKTAEAGRGQQQVAERPGFSAVPLLQLEAITCTV